ncbi:hypothetical protein [Bizionia sp.]|uniref:hypothetical protein n=1 Tax=Bizionia sp. TaxID=1954480 RepID=UPI003A945D47
MYKTKLLFSLISCIILLNFGCKNSTSTDLEETVYQDIFPELVNKRFQDFRKMMAPLPAPPNPNDTIRRKYTREYKDKEEMDLVFKQYRENHSKYLDTTNFVPLIVIVSDSVKGYSKNELKRYSKLKNSQFIETLEFKPSFKLDLSKIKMPNDYILKYKSEYSESLEELRFKEWEKYPNKENRHLHQFSGMLYLYQVYFNSDKTYGFLNVGFNCGKLCGCSFQVFVKKVDGKWVIDDIDNLGCA